MSFWQRLRRSLTGGPKDRREVAQPPLHGPDTPSLLAGAADERLLAIAERLTQAGRTGEALEVLARLQAQRPNDSEVLLRQADLLAARREYGRAVTLLTRALNIREGESDQVQRHIRHQLAIALAESGEPDKARAQLEQVLAEDLDHPEARPLYARLESAARPPTKSELAQETISADAAMPTLLGVGGVHHQRYVLARELGRGSAGTVYLAHDTELDRALAIKIFTPKRHDASAAARAWNEARLTAVVRHPGVMAIYDLDDEKNLVAMELCTGGTLRQRLVSGPLPASTTLIRAAELLDTVATIHKKGIVHGDLKPANLLFRGTATFLGQENHRRQPKNEEQYGDLVIGDFGIARLLAESDLNIQQAAGTLGYLAPERRHDPSTYGPQADLYAVGALILEMLHGVLPLSRPQILRGDPLPNVIPGRISADLGSRRLALEVLLGALLAPDPAVRPDACDALSSIQKLL